MHIQWTYFTAQFPEWVGFKYQNNLNFIITESY